MAVLVSSVWAFFSGHGFAAISSRPERPQSHTTARQPSLRTALPPREDLLALQALVQLGYFRGVTNKLQSMLQAQPECAPFITPLDALSRQYQFEAMLGHLQKALDEPVH